MGAQLGEGFAHTLYDFRVLQAQERIDEFLLA